MVLRKQTDLDKNNSFFREWIGGKSKTSDKYQKSGTGYRAAKFQLDTNKARYTMMLNAGAKIDRARKNLAFAVSGESPPWDLTTRHSPHTCIRVCTHSRVNLPQKGRGSRVARLTYCRARFTRDALDKFLVPLESLIHLDREQS